MIRLTLFADGTPPWEHQAEPDDDDALDEEGDFGNLFAMLRDDYDEASQFTTDFNFIDEDGEVVWAHTKEMALTSVPEQLIARERTAEEWDALTAEVTPVTAPNTVVLPKAQKAQHETNDATVKESAIVSLVERLSFCGMDEAVNDEPVHAIGGKHLVEFVYKAGRTRIVEPHGDGIRRDVERLLGVQIGGESQSGASHGWKPSFKRPAGDAWV